MDELQGHSESNKRSKNQMTWTYRKRKKENYIKHLLL